MLERGDNEIGTSTSYISLSTFQLCPKAYHNSRATWDVCTILGKRYLGVRTKIVCAIYRRLSLKRKLPRKRIPPIKIPFTIVFSNIRYTLKCLLRVPRTWIWTVKSVVWSPDSGSRPLATCCAGQVTISCQCEGAPRGAFVDWHAVSSPHESNEK